MNIKDTQHYTNWKTWSINHPPSAVSRQAALLAIIGFSSSPTIISSQSKFHFATINHSHSIRPVWYLFQINNACCLVFFVLVSNQCVVEDFHLKINPKAAAGRRRSSSNHKTNSRQHTAVCVHNIIHSATTNNK